MPRAKSILVIEDHQHSREALVKLLRLARFEVMAYDSCSAAEAHLQTCDTDIALLDVRMPGRCGDDFGRELRKRCPKTMIVFLTAELAMEPLKAAVPDCFVLRKPVDIAVLLELIECFCTEKGYTGRLSKEAGDQATPGFLG